MKVMIVTCNEEQVYGNVLNVRIAKVSIRDAGASVTSLNLIFLTLTTAEV